MGASSGTGSIEVDYKVIMGVSDLNPKPLTLNPKPPTLNPKDSSPYYIKDSRGILSGSSQMSNCLNS